MHVVQKYHKNGVEIQGSLFKVAGHVTKSRVKLVSNGRSSCDDGYRKQHSYQCILNGRSTPLIPEDSRKE